MDGLVRFILPDSREFDVSNASVDLWSLVKITVTWSYDFAIAIAILSSDCTRKQ